VEAHVPQTAEKEDKEMAPVPSTDEVVPKEMPQSIAEGVPAKKDLDVSGPSVPSASTKDKGKGPLKKYPHEKVATKEVVPMAVQLDEESVFNPLETFPLFPNEDGPRGPKFIKAIHKEKLKFFKESPYNGEHTSLLPRFWTKEQAIYYARILYYKNKIFPHKYLDFAKMERIPCYHDVIERIENGFLKLVLRFCHGWNRKVILQFYATLYISGGDGDMQTWLMEWMTGEEKVTCSAKTFLSYLNLPRSEFDEVHEYRLHHWEITPEQLHLLIDPTKVGDTCTKSNPKNLSYVNKALFYVLCNTITPTNRPENLQGIIAITLYVLSIRIGFDVPDLFITNLAYAANICSVDHVCN
jgi:hypothetical protein